MGRDFGRFPFAYFPLVSIHAPAWGATRPAAWTTARPRFQSTRPHGARRLMNPGGLANHQSFNPRARMGRDRTAATSCSPRDLFQSTRPHGARRQPPSGESPACRFQSTRPHGARRTAATSCSPRDLFQSTRPHGARLALMKLDAWPASFQSTRPHGARRPARPRWAVTARFNPRARMGRDIKGGPDLAMEDSFNPRARMGRDSAPAPQKEDRNVSIHAPAWGATRSGPSCCA